MPRYTRCPFYIDESRNTISCEDVCRSFNTTKKKWAWMDMYCDSWDWMKCPYAIDREEAYRRAEEGDEMAIENQEIQAQKKEIESLLRKLGRANKKIERMQKKIDDLRAVNQSFIGKNAELYKKWRDADSKLRGENDQIWGELGALADIYEQRMCYLIEKYAEGKFYDRDAESWAGEKEFALIHDSDSEGRFWKVVYADEKKNEK